LLTGDRLPGERDVSTIPSPAAASAVAPAAAPPTSARREIRQIVVLVGGALLAGTALQCVVGPGPVAVAATAVGGGALVFAASRLSPGRWTDTLIGFRFASVLLLSLAAAAVLGTIFVQGKPPEYYPARYGTLGVLAAGLRLDDIFHSLWFGALLALFGAAVASSAVVRLPPRRANVGFLLCHSGLLTALLGAAASSALAVKGRADLNAGGESTRTVRVTRNGSPTSEEAALGFELRLDRLDVSHHPAEFRVGYYEPAGDTFSLRASFEPEVGVRHRLPRGGGFRIVHLESEGGQGPAELRNPAAVLEIGAGDDVRQTPLLFALRPGSNFARVGSGVLVFEQTAASVKSFVSHVTLTSGDDVSQARVEVNQPLSYGGWRLYQANFDPRDPTYSGIAAVRDPGVPWVFLGFALICAGVVWTFYAVGSPSPAAAGAMKRAGARP
jgi:hypothetical protein